MARRRVHYVLSSHWDREWYQTFQDYRYRLVRLLDHVIAGLQEGRLVGPFQCDGQAIMLEDYLEIRPERQALVQDLAQRRLLIVGPWYALPDEFLVSGESLIRNLERGRQVARSLGAEPSSAGFACDMFGHNSQLPQILRGFGIRGGFIWRGINVINTSNVVWRGADGTTLPCYRFGPVGYCTYAAQVRHANEYEHPFDPASAAKDIQAFIARQAAKSPVEPLLIFDGCDHQDWDERYYGVLVEMMKDEEQPYEIVHSSLDAYLAEMLPEAERIETLVEGELREPGVYPANIDSQWLIPGVLSSRVWIKQWNARCEDLLCGWAEPFSTLASVALGAEYPHGFLDVAWRWLLQNHPHDSICGCGIDRVHEDMKYRFAQCEDIAERLTTEATRQIAASVAGESAADELRLCLFNPVPVPIRDIVDLTLHIPTYWPAFNEFFGYEPLPAFRIYDQNGQEIHYQRLGQAMGRTQKRLRPLKFPETYRTNDVQISLPVEIPALGYTTLTVRPGEPGHPTRYGVNEGLATGERSMANEHLSVIIEADGTLTLDDKRTGQSYHGLLTFEDTADIGDGWYYGMAANDQRFVSLGSPVSVSLVHNGPFVTTFRVTVVMQVPDSFCFATMRRSENMVPLVIESLVSLRRNSRQVEVETLVHNSAKDHRLRALFPTDAKAQTYLSDTPFDAVERPIALPADNDSYRELAVETSPQQRWTAVSDGQRGLALVAPGLYESAVRDLPQRPIALTLYRATRRTVMTDGEPGGQLMGDLRFRYWIVPLEGPPDPAGLGLLAQRLAWGTREAQLMAEDLALYRGQENLPPSASLLEVDGPALLSSVRQVGDRLEVRLYNPSAIAAEATCSFGQGGRMPPPTVSQRVNLAGDPLGEPEPLPTGRLRLRLGAKEIVTLRLAWD